MSQNHLRPILLIILVALTGRSIAQQPQALAQNKSIGNPGERDVYLNAIKQPSPQLRIYWLEKFIKQYPNSAMKEDALEQELGAWAQALNMQSSAAGVAAKSGIDPSAFNASRLVDNGKLIETAYRLLNVNPDNLKGLAVVVSQKQTLAKTSSDPQQAVRLHAEAAELAKRGLKVVANTSQPASMSKDAFAKYISGVTTLLNSALSTSPQK